jgi:hypothetical protein
MCSGSAFTHAEFSRDALCSHYTRGPAGAGLIIEIRCFSSVPSGICRGDWLPSSCVLNKHRKCPPVASGGHFHCHGRVAIGSQLRIRSLQRGRPGGAAARGPRVRGWRCGSSWPRTAATLPRVTGGACPGWLKTPWALKVPAGACAGLGCADSSPSRPGCSWA